jgi:cytochrome c oxidase subunit 2
MSLKSLIVLGMLSFPAGLLQAVEAPTPVGLEYCTVCHGSQLKGNENIGAPRLSGLPQWYIERQLQNFKLGLRGAHADDSTGGEMKAMVANLSEKELNNIAAWVTQTQSHHPEASIEANADAGKSLYQSCSACHGADGQGNKLMGAPGLVGLNDWYLVTQLNHFRLGIRGTAPADVYGQQMKAASAMLGSEHDAANIAAYINQLK